MEDFLFCFIAAEDEILIDFLFYSDSSTFDELPCFFLGGDGFYLVNVLALLVVYFDD